MTAQTPIPHIDPFAGLADEVDSGPKGQLDALLGSAKRGFVQIRKTLVQQPKTQEVRASVLADFVGGRYQRPLDALLLTHALQPILNGSPLPRRTWARLLSTRTPCSDSTVERTFQTLSDMNLLTVTGSSKAWEITLLKEDGSGDLWFKAGSVTEPGPGFFVLPFDYWTKSFVDRLTIPGKALLLIALAETQDPKKPRFAMAVERAPDFYGISERTAERGYNELRREKLLLVHRQKVADPKHPAGRRDVYWRALASPFATFDRSVLQSDSKARTRKALENAT
jgi:hypothetical protein